MIISTPPPARAFRIHVNNDFIRTIRDPHNPQIHFIHALIKVKDFPHSQIPDDINPRRHENYANKNIDALNTRIPSAIKRTLATKPKLFHILNRGLLIVANHASYDNKKMELTVEIASEEEGGLADGATTDRILGNLKTSKTSDSELTDNLDDVYVKLEVIYGITDNENDGTLISLTEARNTSLPVPEFAFLELGNEYEAIKTALDSSPYRDIIAYKGNEDKPVDIRTVLGILTLFHPKWNHLSKEPTIAYTSKGAVLSYYTNPDWKPGYTALAPVAVDILNFHNYVHMQFPTQYAKAFPKGRLGRLTEITFKKGKPVHSHRLLLEPVNYGIPDGYTYPIIAAFRHLLEWPKNNRRPVAWKLDPKEIFDKYGADLLEVLFEQSDGVFRNNPNAVGKNKGVWKMLRIILQDNVRILW